MTWPPSTQNIGQTCLGTLETTQEFGGRCFWGVPACLQVLNACVFFLCVPGDVAYKAE